MMRRSDTGGSGSSPLVRGPQAVGAHDLLAAGVIPARAGTTRRLPCIPWRRRGHPRSCGDHPFTPRFSIPQTGSSPLVRGPRIQPPDVSLVEGVIPARAGTTSPTCRSSRHRWGHPRSCGDHLQWSGIPAHLTGSSPLVRGPLREDGSVHGLIGVIPARAGTTLTGGSHGRPGRGHPRSCGDHPRSTAESARAAGSSPLVRGPRLLVRARWPLDGVIPARAGTTLRTSASGCASRGHPRSCGDHGSLGEHVLHYTGSSPLVRGPRRVRLRRTKGDGVIPARAGTTCPRRR